MRALLSLILVLPGMTFSQSYPMVPGLVVDDSTGTPVPYAKIYNKTLDKGTISNDDGYFELPCSGRGDTIVSSHLGYQALKSYVSAGAKQIELRLTLSPRLIEGIVITASDNSWMYDLLTDCRKNAKNTRRKGKAYYELTTSRDNEQVELVEGFYNLQTDGYDIADLQIKTGRLAIKPHDNTLFVSMESSNAMIRQELLQKVPYYPISPLQLSRRRMRNTFYLSLDRKYLSPEADSIYILKCEPKNDRGEEYAGLIWVNKTQNAISRVEFVCEDCKRHPFLPLFSSDSIVKVDFQLQKTYLTEKGSASFSFVNLDYDIKYRSRRNEIRDDTFSVHTHALLYAYDYERRFFIPRFDFGPLSRSDYRKINAIPYNEFFWNHHDEYSLNDRKGLNDRFFRSPENLTNLNLFDKGSHLGRGLFERPYLPWSKERIQILATVEDTLTDPLAAGLTSDKYQLEVKVFMDVNTYGDSTDLVSCTLFAPHESFYHLPINKVSNCFVNIFFDLCEMERQRLETEVLALLENPEKIPGHIQKFQAQFKNKKDYWLKEMNTGKNKKAVLRYNGKVFDALKIDNVGIFKPYEEE